MSVRKNKKRKRKVRIIVVSSVFTLLFITTGYAAISTNITLKAKGNILKSSTGTDTVKDLTKTNFDTMNTADVDGNTRYMGSNPNNYITFNEEKDGKGGWRIIGVFGDNIKIIKNTSIGNIAWNSAETNDWNSASLMTNLNSGDYWTNSLSDTAKGQIQEMTWYLGGRADSKVTAAQAYAFERGDTKGGGASSLTWTGNVGLMYPSDYGYASSSCYTGTKTLSDYDDSSCKESNWLFNSAYQWLLSPRSDSYDNALVVGIDGFVDGNNYVTDNSDARPVLYLKSSIKLSGSGTSDDPFTIS